MPLPVRKRSSLRLSLILPFVTLISLLTGTLGVLWYWIDSATVSGLSKQLMLETVQRTAQAIDQNVHFSSAMLETAFPEGLPEAPDIASDLNGLRERLWAAASLRGTPGDYVYYGNVAGQNIGIFRRSGHEAELRLKTQANLPRSYYRLDGIAGTPAFKSTETTLFDPRTRPWFQLARDANGPVWTPVYVDFDAHDMVMTLARRVLSPAGEFEGVVGTDVFLDALQPFVDQLSLIKGERAFILEPDGALLAASGASNLQINPNGQPERVKAWNSGDPMLEAIYTQLRPFFQFAGTPTGTALINDSGGQAIQIAYTHVTDKAGLNWIAVVAVPQDRMLASVRSNVVLVIALGMLALGLALALGLRIFGSIARDMRTLTHAVRRVGLGEIKTPISIARNDEIGELAHNFNHMRDSLFTDALTGCANRSALQHILTTLPRPDADGRPAQPFALLFIDLNRFKPLNDRWGHGNGDLALTEVARRIQAELGKHDVLARLGGDEFVLVLSGIDDDEQAEGVRQRLETALAPALTTLQGIPAGEVVSVGVSVGYGLYPRDGLDAQTLIKHADQDMYRRKGRHAPAGR